MLFQSLEPRGRIRTSLCFGGTMAALHWVGSREMGLAVYDNGSRICIYTRREKKWAKNGNNMAAVVVLTHRQKCQVFLSYCGLPELCDLLAWEEKDNKKKIKPPWTTLEQWSQTSTAQPSRITFRWTESGEEVCGWGLENNAPERWIAKKTKVWKATVLDKTERKKLFIM